MCVIKADYAAQELHRSNRNNWFNADLYLATSNYNTLLFDHGQMNMVLIGEHAVGCCAVRQSMW